jgi:hypothetical protein
MFPHEEKLCGVLKENFVEPKSEAVIDLSRNLAFVTGAGPLCLEYL